MFSSSAKGVPLEAGKVYVPDAIFLNSDYNEAVIHCQG